MGGTRKSAFKRAKGTRLPLSLRLSVNKRGEWMWCVCVEVCVLVAVGAEGKDKNSARFFHHRFSHYVLQPAVAA